MDLQLQGKKALVLAASKGIGFGVALALARENCHVIVASSNADNIQQAKERIASEAGARVDAYVMDVSSSNSVEVVSDAILKVHKKIDILVTNGPGPVVADAATVDPKPLATAIQTNLVSVIELCRKFLPSMIENKYGRLIHLISTTAKEPDVGMVLSNVTRAGVMAYSKTLAREVAKHGVTSNAILTGGVMTERVMQLREIRAKQLNVSYEELTKRASQTFPVGFIATPEQFSHIIAFLASPLSVYITGVNLPVDGGVMRGF